MSHYRESPDPTFEPDATLPYNSIHLLVDYPDHEYHKDCRARYRESIKAMWDYKCAYCGSVDNLTIDHLVSKHHSGGDQQNNLVAACRRCNQSKGSEEVYMWYRTKPYFTEARWAVIAKWMND